MLSTFYNIQIILLTKYNVVISGVKMRKFVILFLACCLFNLPYKNAYGSEVKLSGFFDISMFWIDTSFSRSNSSDYFGANQRFTFQTTYEANENLKGVLRFRINNDWGVGKNEDDYSYGGSIGTDGKSIGVRYAYIDWLVPHTSINVRIGLQQVAFPGFVADSAILDSNATGITATTPINDNIGITGWWIRPYEGKNKSTMDTVGLSIPCAYNGFSMTPWGVYGRIGKNVFNLQKQFGQPNQLFFPFIWTPTGTQGLKDYANIWWLGLTGMYKFSIPFSIAWDFNYGNQSSNTKKFNRAGWYAALLAQYQLTGVTPGLLGWYTTGDKSNLSNGSKRMPTYDSNWTGTSMGFDGYWQDRGTGASIAGNDPTGTWGIAGQLMDISFIDRLKHNLRLAWYQGTNSKKIAKQYATFAALPYNNLPRNGFLTPNGLYLTKKDSVTELNINSFYKIYENLMVGLELSWMHLKLDKKIWSSHDTKSNAYRFICTLRYTF